MSEPKMRLFKTGLYGIGVVLKQQIGKRYFKEDSLFNSNSLNSGSSSSYVNNTNNAWNVNFNNGNVNNNNKTNTNYARCVR
ncbi:MAG: hypothetical protein ACOX2F_04600 [bacterium]